VSLLLPWLGRPALQPLLNFLLLLAAVLPLHAQDQADPAAADTPKETFQGEKIFLRDFGGDEVAYLAIPQTAPSIGVVIAPDGQGLGPGVKRFSDALAAAGYLALAVDLTNGRIASTPEEAAALQAAIDPAVAAKALEAGLLFYEKSPRFRMDRVALIAFGASEAAALQLARSKKGRAVGAVSLIDPASPGTEEGLRARLQRLHSSAPGRDWPAHIPALTAFWSSEETRKTWFERLVE